jgi:Glycosyl hydrolase family 12
VQLRVLMRVLLGLAILATAAAAAVTLIPAGASASGVSVYGTPVCAPGAYVRVTTIPRYTIHDAQGICIDVPGPRKAAFTITSNADTRHWAYPNISAGWEEGHDSCPSARDLADGQCYRFPVQIRHEGEPMASVTATVSRDFTGNVSWDIWYGHHSGDTSYSSLVHGGTEIMIWADHPGITIGRSYAGNPVRSVRLDGRTWKVIYATAAQHGWNYIAFVAPRDTPGLVAMHNVKLNDFSGYVVNRMRLMDNLEFLTAVDVGAEVYAGGAGTTVKSALRGVR